MVSIIWDDEGCANYVLERHDLAWAIRSHRVCMNRHIISAGNVLNGHMGK